jgi:hypothetical protein
MDVRKQLQTLIKNVKHTHTHTVHYYSLWYQTVVRVFCEHRNLQSYSHSTRDIIFMQHPTCQL